MFDRLYIDVTVKFYCLCNVPYDRTAEDTLDNARENADARPYKTDCLDEKTSYINRTEEPAALKNFFMLFVLILLSVYFSRH